MAMKNPRIKLVIRNYDHLAPLACGDVVAEGIDLVFERDVNPVLPRVLSDESIDAGELSLGRHLMRLARGNQSFVGIPIFPNRSFKHRCFFVRRDSGLQTFEQLKGKRIGADEWPTTGNAWSRALLAEHGVDIQKVEWWVGTIDGSVAFRPFDETPPYVQTAKDKTLLSMLLAGELDAVTCPFPPKGFYSDNSPIVRLIPNYRQVEMEYYRRTGIFPIIHLVGMRRAVYERHPAVLRSLFVALDQAKRKWHAGRRQLAETTPWMLDDIEQTISVFGEDWYPYGIEKNLKTIQALCDAQFADGLSPKRLDATEVFPAFESAMAR